MGFFSEKIGPDEKRRRFIGLIFMFTAGFFLSLGNTLYQYIEPYHITADQMMVVRCAVQFILSLIFMVYQKVHIYGHKLKNIFILVLMGVMEVFVILFFYESLKRMPVGDATVIKFTTPVFTSFLSFFALRTKIRFFDALFGVFSFVGVVIIAKPSLFFDYLVVGGGGGLSSIADKLTCNGCNKSNITPAETSSLTSYLDQSKYIEGACFALATAISLSIFLVLNKINGTKLDVILTIFYPGVTGIICGPVVMYFRNEHFLLAELQVDQWLVVLGIAIASFVGLVFLGESLQLQDPGPAIIIRNCDIIIVYVLQYILLHVIPTLPVIVGTLMIITCTSLIILNQTCNLDDKITSCRNNNKGISDNVSENTNLLRSGDKMKNSYTNSDEHV